MEFKKILINGCNYTYIDLYNIKGFEAEIKTPTQKYTVYHKRKVKGEFKVFAKGELQNICFCVDEGAYSKISKGWTVNIKYT